MNKVVIKSYAVFARKLLKNKINERLNKLGVFIRINNQDEEVIFCESEEFQTKEVKELIEVIRKKGYKSILDEAAYEWFIKIILIRFFEVNKYLYEDIGILNSTSPNHKYPDILYKNNNEICFENIDISDVEKMYRKLFIEQCRKLSIDFPKCFKSLKSYVEILLPDNLLEEGFIIKRLISTISEEDYKEIEIIGWLYHFYISEEHHYIVGMNNGIIKKEHIPIATQLFTPEWIVRYMVDNSLGKLLVEEYQIDNIKNNLGFYFENNYKYIKREISYRLEEIKILDPACGTGNILIYCFEVLFKAYLSKDYLPSEIPLLILNNNLYGLDIDSKMIDLATFSLMAKARKLDKEFFKKSIQEDIKMNLISIEESNGILQHLESELTDCSYNDDEKKFVLDICKSFDNAKEYGSLIEVTGYSNDIYKVVMARTKECESKNKKLLLSLLRQANIISTKYDIVVANPPYMSKKYMTANLKSFINKFYHDYNGDLFSVFILRNLKYAKANGYAAFMTPFVWMFIKEYEKLREYIIDNKTLINLIQLQYSAYKEAVVPICTFVLKNTKDMILGTYIKLSDFKGKKGQIQKTIEAIEDKDIFYRYECSSDYFKLLPGKPIAYWIPMSLLEEFSKGNRLDSYIDITGSQNITADNDRFLRKHWEVNTNEINKKWCFYTKGGDYRKWYGNVEYVVDWSVEARDFYKNNKTSNLLNEKYWFREEITYNAISTKGFSARIVGKNIYDKGGPTFHVINKNLEKYILALLNSKVIEYIMNMYNPTMNYQVQDVKNLPIIVSKDQDIINRINKLCSECIHISKEDWDSMETSWEFKTHPMVKYGKGCKRIEDAYEKWKDNSISLAKQLKNHEEELNRLFISIYNLQGIITPDICENNISLHKPDLNKDIKSFISYSVGCILGRYSLDKEGICCGGGNFDASKYKTIKPVEGGICALSKYNLRKDDIVNRFVELIAKFFGMEALNDNIEFVARALKGTSAEDPYDIIREYFILDFFKDHYRMYKKRPIYFMLCSGRRKTLNGIMYIHRINCNSIDAFAQRYGKTLEVVLNERLEEIKQCACAKDKSSKK